MSDRLVFLRAIRAHPDDDTARLAFADWLDEHDEPERAEFIRVQIELEPIRTRIDIPRARELHQREDELLRAHGDDWLGTNHLLTNPADFGPVCRRGLPDYACLSLDTLLANGEALFAAHPTLREVALYGLANRCSDLTLSPLLARLDTLEIADWPTEDDAISLSVSPHLDKIGRFKLWIGGEPHLLNELVRQADSRWPREIELVQVYGGAACPNPEEARELNAAADRIAHVANEKLDRPAVRVTRPFEQMLPLDGDLGDNICAGRLPDGRPALAAGSFGPWLLVIFNEDGRVVEVIRRENPVHSARGDHEYGEVVIAFNASVERWWNEELNLAPGVIWVREFSADELSIEVLPHYLIAEAGTPAPARPPWGSGSDEDWLSRGGRLRSWLEHRNFVIYWGPDHYADWRGKIHSS
jgi:uncharacterized protein (TIGR02996 family)